jgi:hypothetical protein
MAEETGGVDEVAARIDGDVGEEEPQPQAVKITAAATVAVRMFIGLHRSKRRSPTKTN